MRFLVDECTGPSVGKWLAAEGHEVFSVYDESRGATDDELLLKAYQEDYLLITNDKDFGEKIYRDRRPHKGVVFLRLNDERSGNKIAVLRRLLESYADQLPNRFVVVTDTMYGLRNHRVFNRSASPDPYLTCNNTSKPRSWRAPTPSPACPATKPRLRRLSGPPRPW